MHIASPPPPCSLNINDKVCQCVCPATQATPYDESAYVHALRDITSITILLLIIITTIITISTIIMFLLIRPTEP